MTHYGTTITLPRAVPLVVAVAAFVVALAVGLAWWADRRWSPEKGN